MLPPRRYERLARLLLGLVHETLDHDVAVASAGALGLHGEQTAEESAGDGQRPARLSPAGVMEWMDLAGYGATLSADGDGTTVIEVRNCVYRELAEEYPEWCAPSTAACSAACWAVTRRCTPRRGHSAPATPTAGTSSGSSRRRQPAAGRGPCLVTRPRTATAP